MSRTYRAAPAANHHKGDEHRRRENPMSNINETTVRETGGLTVEHVQRAGAFNKRVNANVAKIRDASKQLQRCANRKLYAYDEQDVATILDEARRAIDELEAAFRRASEAPARNAPWDLSIAKRARAARDER